MNIIDKIKINQQKDNIKKLLNIGKKKLKELVEDNKKEELVLLAPPELNKVQKQIVELSILSVFKSTALIIFMIWMAGIFTKISDILITIFISGILAATFDPWVDYLEEKRIPRAIGIFFIYIIIIGFVSIIIAYYFPILYSQLYAIAREIRNLNLQDISNLPFHEKIQPILDKIGIDAPEKQELIAKFQNQLVNLGNSLFKATSSMFTFIFGIFGGLFTTVTVLILTFYIVLENNSIEKFIASMFSREHQPYVAKQINTLKSKLGGWMRGQFLLMILMGMTVWLFLAIAGVPYAATLGLLAGFMELIPYVGAIVMFVPAIIVGFMNSLFTGVLAGITIFAAQTVEGNFYVPMVMKKAVGLSPVITIISMLIGGKLMGVGGIILSVPVAALISVFVNDYTAKNIQEAKQDNNRKR